MYGEPPQNISAFHFFKGSHQRLDGTTDLCALQESYQGYCLVRPDWTVCHSLIAGGIIIRERDTYAYLVSRVKETVRIIPDVEMTVEGFPYVEKDGRGVMCSQASLGIIAEYWNRLNGSVKFGASTAVDINSALNIPKDDVLKGKGLSMQQIGDFCAKNHVACVIKDFSRLTVDMIRDQRPETDIYGYVDSKFPVCGVVKTAGDLHALTMIGHTFDRNNWNAIADLHYYRRPLSGDGLYYSNLTWVRNFLIQDDNFGPYFFLPWDNLPDILVAYIVPIPDGIKISPLQSERIAIHGIRLIADSYAKIVQSGQMPAENKFWADRLAEKSNDGLVLRPIFMQKDDLLAQYRDHPFFQTLQNLLNEWGLTWYSAVEISWPDIYCYQRTNVGLVLLDPSRDAEELSKGDIARIMPFIHLPGVGFFRHTDKQQGKLDVKICGVPDTPSHHFIPSRQHDV